MFGWIKNKLGIPKPTSAGIRTFALMMVAPIFAGLLAWQLYEIGPDRLCKTSFDLARIDGVGYLTAFQACFALYEKGLSIRDHAIIGLLTILGLGYLMMLMRELRMQGELKGPLGIGGNFRPSDSDEPAPPVTPADGAALAENAVASVVDNLRDGER